MRTVLHIASMALACVLSSCGNAEPPPSAPVSSSTAEAAEKLAEAAFLETTKHEVTTYSIQEMRHTASHWRFVVEGTGEFALPGYQWFVSIDRVTGASSVLEGE
jgi:hypothetical protein